MNIKHRIYQFNTITFILFPMILWLVYYLITQSTPYSISRTYYSDLRYVFVVGMTIILVNHLLMVIAEKANYYRLVLSILLTICYSFILMFPTSFSGTSETYVGLFMVPIQVSHIIHRVAVLIYFSLYMIDMVYLLYKKRLGYMGILIPLYMISIFLLVSGIAFDFNDFFDGYTYLMEMILLDLLAVYFYFLSKQTSKDSSDIIRDEKNVDLSNERRD